MADAPTFVVMKRWAEHLSGVMPPSVLPQVGAGTVPVYYSHPGDRHLGPDCVWFDRVIDDYNVVPLKAGRRRRLLTSTFQAVIEVFIEGASAASDWFDLQHDCDLQASAIRQVIDEDIADEEHLHCPDLIDVAKLVQSRTERGLTATGAGTRIILDVSFDARIL